MQPGFPKFRSHEDIGTQAEPFKLQLLKWIGNKQRFAHEIIGYFPDSFGTYFEPFLGSGAVLGTLAPHEAFASDALKPLIEIWETLKTDPVRLKQWYEERWTQMMERQEGSKEEGYEKIKASFNADPNGADLLMIARACYGGVMRFRKKDGYLSTPCGTHDPITPGAFAQRVNEWHPRIQGSKFLHSDFQPVMKQAEAGDLVYCDPPYTHTQGIVYGAQSFNVKRLFRAIKHCKERDIFVVLSIDGSKKSGDVICDVPIPEGVFEREAFVNCGRSMLRRFQREGDSLEDEVVRDRLFLTY